MSKKFICPIKPGEWIPCEDALPDDGEVILVAGTGLNTRLDAKPYIYSDTARFEKDRFGLGDKFLGAYGTITHWMRIPKLREIE